MSAQLSFSSASTWDSSSSSAFKSGSTIWYLSRWLWSSSLSLVIFRLLVASSQYLLKIRPELSAEAYSLACAYSEPILMKDSEGRSAFASTVLISSDSSSFYRSSQIELTSNTTDVSFPKTPTKSLLCSSASVDSLFSSPSKSCWSTITIVGSFSRTACK